MATRLDLEEKMSRVLQEKTALENKLKNLEKDLEEEKAAQKSAKSALIQEQLVSQSLKEELAKVNNQLQAFKEAELKEASESLKKTKKK